MFVSRDLQHRTIVRAVALLLVATAVARAQQPAAGIVARATAAPADRIELSASQVRAILTAHQPGIVNGTSDDNIATIVLASNGDFVTSGTSKEAAAGVIRATAGTASATAVPAGAGGFVATGGGAGGVTTTPRATAGLVPHDDDGQPHFIKIAGIGDIDASLIKDMYWAHFSAGDVSVNGLAVRIVTLKGTAMK